MKFPEKFSLPREVCEDSVKLTEENVEIDGRFVNKKSVCSFSPPNLTILMSLKRGNLSIPQEFSHSKILN